MNETGNLHNPSQDTPSRSRRYLAAILALSVLLRLVVSLYLGDVVDAPPLLTDQRSYHALGARLVERHGFSFERAWYPFTPADTPTAHWSYLYSLLIAAVYALFGPHPLAVRLVQSVLGGLLLRQIQVQRIERLLLPAERRAYHGARPPLVHDGQGQLAPGRSGAAGQHALAGVPHRLQHPPGEVYVARSGGSPAESNNWDLMTQSPDAIEDLKDLRLGDIVLLQDILTAYGRGYYEGAVTVGVIACGASNRMGQGIGVTTILTCKEGEVVPMVQPGANISNYLKLGGS